MSHGTNRHPFRTLGFVASGVLLALVAACAAGSGDAGEPELGGPTAPVSNAATDSPSTSGSAVVAENGTELPSCGDRPGVRDCLLPFPSNRLTVVDQDTATGRRVSIPVDAVPVNVDGSAMDVTDQNRADGFSPSSVIVFAAEGVDLGRSQVPDVDDIGSSMGGATPIRLIDLDTGDRWPYWGELDVQSRLVMIRPARLLAPGHTYSIEIGRLVDRDDEVVELESSYWEFTVASVSSITGRLLSMLETSYGLLGDGTPSFTVDTVATSGGVRTVDGTFRIPNFLDNDGSPGGRLLLEADLPVVNSTSPDWTARYRCVLPETPSEPVPPIVYGHGLLGSRSEVDFFGSFASLGTVAACATDWLGMSSDDVVNLAGILADLGRFGEQADRMLAGQVAFQMLGRLLNDPSGFASHEAFRDVGGKPVIAADSVIFVGNSQGGILGGAATAVSIEWDRAVLGVPGVNYSLLLPRSSDWPQFQAEFERSYLDVNDRLMAIVLAQMLWDRGENAGYVQYLAGEPLPGTDSKEVLLVGAFGDHQVANVSTDLLARSIGARIHRPALAPGRATAVEPFWGIDSIDAWPYRGSAYVMWDFGTPAPPSEPTPPFSPVHGKDPHGAGSSEPLVLVQALGFLLDGVLTDVCAGSPCTGARIDD